MRRSVILIICLLFINFISPLPGNSESLGETSADKFYYLSLRRMRIPSIASKYISLVETGIAKGIFPEPSFPRVKFKSEGFEGIFDSLDGRSIKLELYALAEILKATSTQPSLILTVIPAFLKFPEGIGKELLTEIIPLLESLAGHPTEPFYETEGFLGIKEKEFVGIEALKYLIEIKAALGDSKGVGDAVDSLMAIVKEQSHSYKVRAAALRGLLSAVTQVESPEIKNRALVEIFGLGEEIETIAGQLPSYPEAVTEEKFSFMKAYFDVIGMVGELTRDQDIIIQAKQAVNRLSPDIRGDGGKAIKTVLAVGALLRLGISIKDGGLVQRSQGVFQEYIFNDKTPKDIAIFSGLLLLKMAADDKDLLFQTNIRGIFVRLASLLTKQVNELPALVEIVFRFLKGDSVAGQIFHYYADTLAAIAPSLKEEEFTTFLVGKIGYFFSILESSLAEPSFKNYSILEGIVTALGKIGSNPLFTIESMKDPPTGEPLIDRFLDILSRIYLKCKDGRDPRMAITVGLAALESIPRERRTAKYLFRTSMDIIGALLDEFVKYPSTANPGVYELAPDIYRSFMLSLGEKDWVAILTGRFNRSENPRERVGIAMALGDILAYKLNRLRHP